jgi:glycosyltransferase involved in cell wall biosynthesis
MPKKDECRILALFLHDCEYGKRIRGDERRFLELAKRFKYLGATVYAVEWFPSLQRGFGEKIYECIELRPPRSKFFRIPYAIFKTIILSRKLKYDVIYAHNQDIQDMLVGYALKVLFRKPLVVVLHWEYKLFEEGCLRNLRQRKKILTSVLLLVTSFIIKRFIFPRVDYIFATNSVARDHAIDQLKLKPEKFIISGNGVDCDKFKPENVGKKYDVVYLGRIDFVQKGIDVLLKAWKIVALKRKNSKLILIGGFNSQEDYRKLVNMLKELDLEDSVEFTGFVNDKKIVELLNSAKVFVFPTRFDGFTLAVLEAMACGLPCIISDIPTYRNVYSKVAVLVKCEDYEEFAKAILKLLDDEDMRKYLGIASRLFACAHQWMKVAKAEFNIMNLLRNRWQGARGGSQHS